VQPRCCRVPCLMPLPRRSSCCMPAAPRVTCVYVTLPPPR
jgi:hypothetical protein